MTRNVEHQLKELKKVHLTSEVRLRMREELLSYADLHAIPADSSSAQSAGFRFFTLGSRAYTGLAAMMLLIVGAGGTTYAAEKTLPGDVLYTVKTHVSEPIQTALIPSTKGQATWHAVLAERRLEEAATLASKNKLSESTQEELAANLSLHVVASAHSADELEMSGDSAASLDARSDLEARLTAHEQILSIMMRHFAEASSTESRDTSHSVQKLLAVVESHKTAIEGMRLALQYEIDPASAPTNSVAMAKVSAKSEGTTGATSTLAIAKSADASATTDEQRMGAARVASSDVARMEEVQTILAKHATMLAQFLPTATSTGATATSTATTTATTTIEVQINDGDK